MATDGEARQFDPETIERILRGHVHTLEELADVIEEGDTATLTKSDLVVLWMVVKVVLVRLRDGE